MTDTNPADLIQVPDYPAAVAEALDPETFDVLDFVAGQGTPLDKVKIYTDNESGYRLAQLAEIEENNAKRAEIEGLGIADEVEWADPDEIAELQTRIEATALTFELRGLAPAAKKAIRARLVAEHNYKESLPAEDQEPFFKEHTYTLIAKTIDRVVRADGAIDPRPWTVERVASLHESLNETEFSRLDQAVYILNFQTDIFDRAASADFLSKR